MENEQQSSDGTNENADEMSPREFMKGVPRDPRIRERLVRRLAESPLFSSEELEKAEETIQRLNDGTSKAYKVDEVDES